MNRLWRHTGSTSPPIDEELISNPPIDEGHISNEHCLIKPYPGSVRGGLRERPIQFGELRDFVMH